MARPLGAGGGDTEEEGVEQETPVSSIPATIQAHVSSPGKRLWDRDKAQKLQEAVDAIFGKATALKGLQFSFTLADPNISGCPLIGCSNGFQTLCGYDMEDIVGRNCRFLVDPVPQGLVDDKVRTMSRDYCQAVLEGKPYTIPPELFQPWMPQNRTSDDGIFCLQMNTRKDGTLFRNMFYLKAMELDDDVYILGLQTEVGDQDSYDAYHEACRLLDENFGQVERVLFSFFWCSGPMRRQEDRQNDDGFPIPGFAKVPVAS